jgi:RNA polymerase sigma-70 factor (ECF subfamily)
MSRVESRDSAGIPTLEVLIGRVREGDKRAFAEFYDQISSRVFGLIKGILRDPAQSEEVMQEVFLEIWQTASRFDENKGRVLSWVLTMARRRAIDRVRASQASRTRDEKIGMRDIDVSYDSVAESVEVRVEHRRVVEAMDWLTDLQREVIELAYTGGYTQAEVAEMLNVPVGTVKTRLRDGLIHLRAELAATA